MLFGSRPIWLGMVLACYYVNRAYAFIHKRISCMKNFKLTEMSITCPKCGMTSHNPNDVRERYCGNCQVFIDDAEFVKKYQKEQERTRRTIDDVWRPSKK